MTSGGSLYVRSTVSIRSAVAVHETLGSTGVNDSAFLMDTASPLASSVGNSSADSSRKHDGITSSILVRSSVVVATNTDLSFNSSILTSGYYHENSSFPVDVAASAVTMATMINVTTAKIKVEEVFISCINYNDVCYGLLMYRVIMKIQSYRLFQLVILDYPLLLIYYAGLSQ